VSSPRSAGPNRGLAMPHLNRGWKGEAKKGARIKPSLIAKRQLRMQAEEMDIIRRCAMQCWARAAVPSHIRGQLLGRGEGRRRSLTCP